MGAMVSHEMASARSQWEIARNTSFPGRKWGVELLCDLAPSPDTRNEKRIKFTDRVLGWMAIMSGKGGGGAEWFRGQMHGAEVGACGNPIRIPRGIGRMTYIELDLHNGQKMKGSCYDRSNRLSQYPGRKTINADGQTLRTIRNESFDFLLTSHVLEHIPDVLGTLHQWLRVVRPGGAVMFLLPDPCDPSWDTGEKARLATAPEHFIQELRNPTLVRANEHEHLREHAIMVRGMGETYKRTKDDWAALIRPGKHPLGYPDDWMDTHPLTPYDIEVMAQQREQDADRDERKTGARATQGHLHVWTWFTLKKMLELAQPKLAALGTPFHVHTQYATEKRIGGESMKEFRVALIREREAGRRMSAPAGMAPTSEAIENLERFMSGR